MKIQLVAESPEDVDVLSRKGYVVRDVEKVFRLWTELDRDLDDVSEGMQETLREARLERWERYEILGDISKLKDGQKEISDLVAELGVEFWLWLLSPDRFDVDVDVVLRRMKDVAKTWGIRHEEVDPIAEEVSHG